MITTKEYHSHAIDVCTWFEEYSRFDRKINISFVLFDTQTNSIKSIKTMLNTIPELNTGKQRRIEFLNLPPNKPNIEAFPWQFRVIRI